MMVLTTLLATEQIIAIDAWWRANRRASPDLFIDELADAFQLLEVAPTLGSPWKEASTPDVRRVLLRTTRYHVYYEIDGTNVVVLAVWSAIRGRGPSI